jgi:hypothetical protein
LSPKVADEKGYTVVVFTREPDEPAHVHVIKDGKIAKFSLSPVDVIEDNGFSQKMIAEAIDIVRRHKGHCWAVWHQTHGQ